MSELAEDVPCLYSLQARALGWVKAWGFEARAKYGEAKVIVAEAEKAARHEAARAEVCRGDGRVVDLTKFTGVEDMNKLFAERKLDGTCCYLCRSLAT